MQPGNGTLPHLDPPEKVQGARLQEEALPEAPHQRRQRHGRPALVRHHLRCWHGTSLSTTAKNKRKTTCNPVA